MEKQKLLGEEVIEKVINSLKDPSPQPVEVTSVEYTAAMREISLDLANLRLQRVQVQTEAQQQLSTIDELIAAQEKVMAALERSHFYAVLKGPALPEAPEEATQEAAEENK